MLSVSIEFYFFITDDVRQTELSLSMVFLKLIVIVTPNSLYSKLLSPVI